MGIGTEKLLRSFKNDRVWLGAFRFERVWLDAFRRATSYHWLLYGHVRAIAILHGCRGCREAVSFSFEHFWDDPMCGPWGGEAPP